MILDSQVDLSRFQSDKFAVVDDFLSLERCRQIIHEVDQLIAEKGAIEAGKNKALGSHFRTVNGAELLDYSPEIRLLHAEVLEIVNEQLQDEYVMLDNQAVGVSVNITPPGGNFNFHFDRNALTTVIYLNEVEGGEMTCFPRLRCLVPGRYSYVGRRVQVLADKLVTNSLYRNTFARQVVVQPKPGRLLAFRGAHCYHRVSPVAGSADRYSIQLAYDRPGVEFGLDKTQDYYGYRR